MLSQPDIIRGLAHKVSEENGVHVLMCVENGSRAWNMHSKDSDYDVRFVFVRPLKDYITLKSKPDVITANFDKDKNKCRPEDTFYDFVGFDIHKYCKMLSSSNPTCIEWATSNIRYIDYDENFSNGVKEFSEKQYNPLALYHHYRSMCKQNYEKYLKDGTQVTYKKYLYAMRGLTNAKYISATGLLPPLNFVETLDKCEALRSQGVEVVSLETIAEIRDIISKKKEGNEQDIVKNNVRVDDMIESFLKNIDAPDPVKSFTTDLDKLLKKVVLMEDETYEGYN